MPSSASRLRRASHTSGSSLDISRPLRSSIVTLLAEAAHRLGHLHSHVAPTGNKQVFGISSSSRASICGERLPLRKAGIVSSAARVPRTNDHIRAPQLTCGPIGPGLLHRSRSQKPARSQYELGSRVPVIFHIHVVQATHHPALRSRRPPCLIGEAVVCDAESLLRRKYDATFALW